jgi:hypothetical protein
MKKYRVKENGETLLARSPTVLVDLLNRCARMPSPSPKEYMRDYIRRSAINRDVDIRATDFDSFVEDLVAIGDLEVI